MIPKKRSSATIRESVDHRSGGEALRPRVRQVSNARLVIPLTAGKHVDHVITRLAAERLNEELDLLRGLSVRRATGAHDARLGTTRDEWASESIGLSEDALQAKIEAFLLHRSQISTFYRDDEEVRAADARLRRIGGRRPTSRTVLASNCNLLPGYPVL